MWGKATGVQKNCVSLQAERHSKYVFDMSEKQKQVEKERRGVLEILLQKNGLKRKELVDFLLGVWVAGKIDELTEQEKAQFPNLAF